MNPARFEQIAELYHSLRERSAQERTTILREVDPELRREVESLLAQATGDGFLERPVFTQALSALSAPAAPALNAGDVLGPYRIEQKLGEGGMGEVYRAIDTRLGRAVAIKLVHARFSDRFRREAQAISALNHPNICTLFDIGPNFMVMELVEGETLAARLRAGAMPVGTALEYARQILSGLIQAHAKGIVHRDLKPGNLMLAPSGIKILDFGLAKSLHDETLTATGLIMGTPGYAAPEQRQGRTGDQRSDIYSFGCVLHEMLTGSRVGPYRKAIVSRRLDAIIERCLEEDPQRRWSSVDALAQALAQVKAADGWRERTLAAGLGFVRSHPAWTLGIAGLLAATVLALAWRSPGPGTRMLTDKDSLVLADFSNRTGDPVFDGSLRQGLSVQLEQSPLLSIIPESRARQALALMNQPADAKLTSAIAQDLCQRVGGAAVVEGSIAQVGAPYQLTLRAIDCSNGATIASTEAIAQDKSRVLEALGKASTRIRVALGESLGSVQRHDTPLELATTSSLDALKAYSEGMGAMRAGDEPAAAIALFKRAIELDPQFALAYGALTIEYTNRGESLIAADYARKAYALRDKVSEQEKYFITARYGRSGTGDIELAVQACQAWIQAYPRVLMPRLLLAGSIYPVIGDYTKASAQGAEAVRMAPTMAIAHVLLMDSLIAQDQIEQAKAAYAKAQELKLQSPFFALELYQLAFLHDDQAGMARQVAQAAGQPVIAHSMLALAAETAAWQGRLRQARALSEQAMDQARRDGATEPRATYQAMAALREAQFGNAQEAQERARSALEWTPSRDVQFGAALTFAFAGNTAQAQALTDALASQYPQDTLVQSNYLPVLRSKLALDHGDASQALDLLRNSSAHELAMTRSSLLGWTSLYPIFLRGEALLALQRPQEAAAEFGRVLSHRGLVLNYPIGLMARLRQAQALAQAGQVKEAASAYARLLAQWKDADPDLPVLGQARAEAARLP